MLTLFAPTDAALAALLQSQRDAAFTYPGVGQSREATAPAGHVLDHNRVQLGHGGDTFERAKDALRRWAMFPAWVRITPAGSPIQVGQSVAIVARVMSLWWTNVARIVYTLDEPRRFGFGYGTLPEHVESGEERFLVEWRDDDTVWYDLLAFSRPRHWLACLGYPMTRRTQWAFSRDSLQAMRSAVGGAIS